MRFEKVTYIVAPFIELAGVRRPAVNIRLRASRKHPPKGTNICSNRVVYKRVYNADMTKKMPATREEAVTLLDGRSGWRYSDGSIRGEGGKMLQQLPGTQEITAQNAHEMARIRRERKQSTIMQAANDAVERADYRNKYGDLAFLAALAETAYIKATTAEDPKAIDAARFLLQETGLAEAKQELEQRPNLLERAGIIALAAELARRMVAGAAETGDG